MQISPVLAGGLLLALLSVGLEAKPASQLPQKVGLSLPRCCAPKESLGRGGGTAGSSFPLGGGAGPREAREARAETRPRAGWARLLQEPSGRRHKGLHKKGLGKGCFGLKLDRIGAMSGLGC
uniref:Natriuretic peptide C n=1 Tax=Gallus gallus TaxID=9031 RepID=A0A3Q2TRT0_CHICK